MLKINPKKKLKFDNLNLLTELEKKIIISK